MAGGGGGGMGTGDGPPGGGAPGTIGIGGRGGSQSGGYNQQPPPVDANTPFVCVVVEQLGYEQNANIYGNLLKHKWGKSVLFEDSASVEVFPVKMESASTQFTKKRRTLDTKKPDKIYELASWALERGLVDECGKLLDELVAEAAKNKDQTSVTQAAVAAYTALKPKLDAAPRGRATESWKGRLSGFKVSTSNEQHYDVLYNADTVNGDAPPEVKSQMASLERNFRGFFYWFALKGIALDPPAERMVAVVVKEPKDFSGKRLAFDDSPLTERFVAMRAGGDDKGATLTLAGSGAVGTEKLSGMLPLYSDGFLARRDNILFLSPHRLDSASVEFSSLVQGFVRQGWDRHECLAGKGVSMDVVKNIKDPEQRKKMVAYVHTLMLVDRALEEEAELAAISYEGTRQLLAATGVQPRTLQLPEWLQFGIASTFDTPKGPYPASLNTKGMIAYWHGYGGPSWSYLRQFQDWQRGGKLDPAGTMLRKVVTDAYFLDSKAGSDKDALYKARTLSWALSYFLTQQNLPGFQKFNAELANLPRDLELSAETISDCFARSFGLAGANGEVDAGACNKFADDWVDFLKGKTPPSQAEHLEEAAPPPGLPGARPPGGGSGGSGGGTNPG